MSETRKRRPYDEAFKRDAVRLDVEEKYSFARAAEAVGVSEQSLRAPPSITKSCYRWLGRPITQALPSLPEFNPSWIPERLEPTLPAVPLSVEDDLPKSELIERARRYVSHIRAVESEGGDKNTFRVACKLRDFGLSKEEALAEFIRWNQANAEPPWELPELERKLAIAFRATK